MMVLLRHSPRDSRQNLMYYGQMKHAPCFTLCWSQSGSLLGRRIRPACCEYDRAHDLLLWCAAALSACYPQFHGQLSGSAIRQHWWCSAGSSRAPCHHHILSVPQWRACVTVRSCSEKDCKPEAELQERPRQLLPAWYMLPCIEPLMSLTDTMEISGSSHYPAKVVWGMHAGQTDRLKYARGLVGASLRL